MRTYARIENGVVAELFATDGDISKMFHPSLVWVESAPGVVIGSTHGESGFGPPPVPPAPTREQALARLRVTLAHKEAEGVFFNPTGADVPLRFPADPSSLARYIAAAAAPAARHHFIAADGSPVELSASEAAELVDKVVTFLRECAANYAALHGVVLSDPSADVSVGWPSNA